MLQVLKMKTTRKTEEDFTGFDAVPIEPSPHGHDFSGNFHCGYGCTTDWNRPLTILVPCLEAHARVTATIDEMDGFRSIGRSGAKGINSKIVEDNDNR